MRFSLSYDKLNWCENMGNWDSTKWTFSLYKHQTMPTRTNGICIKCTLTKMKSDEEEKISGYKNKVWSFFSLLQCQLNLETTNKITRTEKKICLKWCRQIIRFNNKCEALKMEEGRNDLPFILISSFVWNEKKGNILRTCDFAVGEDFLMAYSSFVVVVLLNACSECMISRKSFSIISNARVCMK